MARKVQTQRELSLRVGDEVRTGYNATPTYTVVQVLEDEGVYILEHMATGEFYEHRPYRGIKHI